MVVLIPVSVATAFSMSLVPEMTKAYTAGNTKLLYKHFTRTNVLVVAITVPAAIGMMVLAKPVYTLLFGAGNDPEMGRIILQYYAPACILFSLFTVTAAMLQGINQQQKTVLGLFPFPFNLNLITSFFFFSSLFHNTQQYSHHYSIHCE